MINETDTKKGNSMDLNRQLIEAMADLNEDLVIATVRQMAAEGHSFEEIQQCLNTGISAVGTRFERGDYFIADLIVSGMIYRSALNEREPLRSGGAPRPLGKVVIGVVAGDIHDIGKDIIVSLLRAERFDVVDLGIDVKPERFVHAVRNYHPDVVLLSGVKLLAELRDATEESVTLAYEEKVAVEGKKRKQLVETVREYPLSEVKSTREYIDFK